MISEVPTGDEKKIREIFSNPQKKESIMTVMKDTSKKEI